MSEEKSPEWRLVHRIVEDICGRNGIDDAWHDIDVETRNEITTRWEGFCREAMVSDIHFTEIEAIALDAELQDLVEHVFPNDPAPMSNSVARFKAVRLAARVSDLTAKHIERAINVRFHQVPPRPPKPEAARGRR